MAKKTASNGKRVMHREEEFEIMKLVLDKFLWLGVLIIGYGLYKFYEGIADSLVSAEAISSGFASKGKRIPLLLKVDMGLGRCGVDPARGDTVDLAKKIAGLPGLAFRGILSHAGQVYSAAGTTTEERRATVGEIGAMERDSMIRFAGKLREAGVPVEEVSVGSTPAALTLCPCAVEILSPESP